MKPDNTLARLLSDFFLDIAKAAFIAAFVTSPFGLQKSALETISILARALLTTIVYLWFSWKFAKLEEEK